MGERSPPNQPSRDEEPRDPLEAVFKAAYEPDPMESPYREDSVLDVLSAKSGSESRVRLKELSNSSSADDGSPSSTENQDRTGRYKVLGEMARGGLGIIMKSRDMDLGRDVAMKLLKDKHALNPKMIRRLVEEAQIGGQLQHPGIVPVYEMGLREGQQPFFTMKLVKGQTLAALLKGRKDPGEDLMRFLRIFEQICQTMAYAHARGVIHRDLKPSNIMVGAFGEVQVMDWGLAKVLDEGRADGEEGAAKDSENGPTLETIRTVSGEYYSEVGSVMGTFGYMAPEQVRGETGTLDERCDVFGLGALLCVTLTGKPPFAGEDPDTIRQRAREGKLDECFERLEASSVEPKLEDLAKKCLAPSLADRPRNAGEVAREMEVYLAEVAERARRSELQAAESRVRAEEAEARVKQERRAKRLGVSLAAVVVLAVALGAWIEMSRRDRVARTTEAVSTAIARAQVLWDEARTAGLDDLTPWFRAREMGENAQGLVDAREVPAALRESVEAFLEELDREAAAARKDHDMLRRMEAVRNQAGENWNWTEMDQGYTAAFRDYGIDMKTMDPEEAARRINESAIAREMVGEMYEWILIRSDTGGDREKLFQVVRLADPDEWRQELRQAWSKGDHKTVSEMSESINPSELSPIDAHVLTMALAAAKDHGAIQSILSQVFYHHPEDFWVHYNLGWSLFWTAPDRMNEAIGYFRTALSIRPRSVIAWSYIAKALFREGRLDEARKAYTQGLHRNPDNAFIHHDLGVFLSEKLKDYDGALERLEEAVRLDPESGEVHASVGMVWQHKGDLVKDNLDKAKQDYHDKAWEAYERACELDPDHWKARGNMALICRDRGDHDGALRYLEEAIKIKPKSNQEQCTLYFAKGYALEAQEKWDEAIEAYKEAIRLDGNHASAHYNLGCLHMNLGNFKEALDCFEKTNQIGENAENYNKIGFIWMEGDDYDPEAAIVAFGKALALDPEHDWANFNNVIALSSAGRYQEALERARIALPLLPSGKELPVLLMINDFETMLGMLEEAERTLGKTIKKYPEAPRPRFALANLLLDIGRGEDAVNAFNELLNLWPDHHDALIDRALAYQTIGQFSKALTDLRRARQLVGEGSGYPFDDWLYDCEKMVSLVAQLPEYLEGTAAPDSPRDQMILALVCKARGYHAAAAQFFDEALGAQPDLGDDAWKAYWFRAAGAAALAASGAGRDSTTWNEATRVRWRKQALAWLEKDVAVWEKASKKGDTGVYTIQRALKVRTLHPDLQSIRDPDALAGLPGSEREAFEAYWSRVNRAAGSKL